MFDNSDDTRFNNYFSFVTHTLLGKAASFVVHSNCSILCQQTDTGTDRAITLKIQDQESCFVEAIYEVLVFASNYRHMNLNVYNAQNRIQEAWTQH